jgi:hypothetical protein
MEYGYVGPMREALTKMQKYMTEEGILLDTFGGKNIFLTPQKEGAPDLLFRDPVALEIVYTMQDIQNACDAAREKGHPPFSEDTRHRLRNTLMMALSFNTLAALFETPLLAQKEMEGIDVYALRNIVAR